MRMTKTLTRCSMLIAIVMSVSSAHAHYSPELGRWLERDPAGDAGGVDLYQYARSGPIGFSDASGRAPEHPGDPRPTNWEVFRRRGPRLLDGRQVSYQIWLDYYLPTPEGNPTQFWQTVSHTFAGMTQACEREYEHKWIIDIVNIGGRKMITDSIGLLKPDDYCIAAELAVHRLGFDDEQSNFAQQTNRWVVAQQAHLLNRQMRGPTRTITMLYLYLNKEHCRCCKDVQTALNWIGTLAGMQPRDGESLWIQGVGQWSSF